MKRLTPKRQTHVATTYETELTETEFTTLVATKDLTLNILGRSDPMSLDSVADEILKIHGDDFIALARRRSILACDFRGILKIINGFDYASLGKLTLSEFSETTGYTIRDGNHQAVALALLLKSKKIYYQPVTVVFTERMAAFQHLAADDLAFRETQTAARQGMRHFPVRTPKR